MLSIQCKRVVGCYNTWVVVWGTLLPLRVQRGWYSHCVDESRAGKIHDHLLLSPKKKAGGWHQFEVQCVGNTEPL